MITALGSALVRCGRDLQTPPRVLRDCRFVYCDDRKDFPVLGVNYGPKKHLCGLFGALGITMAYDGWSINGTDPELALRKTSTTPLNSRSTVLNNFRIIRIGSYHISQQQWPLFLQLQRPLCSTTLNSP